MNGPAHCVACHTAEGRFRRPDHESRHRLSVALNLLAGGSSYDLEGTGTSLAAAGRWTWQWKPALAIEPGLTYFAFDADASLLFPELSVQVALPRGPIRPYLAGGFGFTVPTSGGGGTHRSLHAALGARMPLRDDRWCLRGEFRIRSAQQWGSTTADYLFGLGWKLP